MASCVSPVWVARQKIFVPCGRCNFCLAARRGDWSFRLSQEYLVSDSAFFFTMTYADMDLVFNVSSRLSELLLRDVQLWFKKLRKRVAEFYPSTRLRYYLVGEYGDDSGRPHYHVLMFNLPPMFVGKDEMELTQFPDGVFVDPAMAVSKCWRGGLVHVGCVTGASIYYVVKYHVNKLMEWPGRAPPFAVMSRRPGIGAAYADSGSRWQRSEGGRSYVVNGDYKMRLPRYYKEKMFWKPEREAMANRLIDEMDARMALEIERVSKVHPDPLGYIYEMRDQAYGRITEKNKLDSRFKL